MTVAVKAKIERQSRYVVAMGEFQKCSIHSQSELVLIERYSFGTGKFLGQVGASNSYLACDLIKAYPLSLPRNQQLFGLVHRPGVSWSALRIGRQRF